MKPVLLILFYVVCISIGCKKVYPTTEVHNDTTIVVHTDTTIIQDTTIYQNIKQVGYDLPTFNTSDTVFIPTEYYSLKKFDIDNVEFELYDITDSIPIEGSKITFTKQDANTNAYYQSGNIVNNLPHKEISLGISMHSSNAGTFKGLADATLFVYMK